MKAQLRYSFPLLGCLCLCLLACDDRGQKEQTRRLEEAQREQDLALFQSAVYMRDLWQAQQLLLSRDLPIEPQEDYAAAALILAAENGQAAMLDTLLKAGVAADAKGGAALTAAAKMGQTAMLGKLLDQAENVPPDLLKAALRSGREDCVQLLLEKGLHIKFSADELYYFFTKAKPPMRELLLSKTAQIPQELLGEMLCRAAQDDNAGLALALLAHGAKQEVCLQGYSPAAWALLHKNTALLSALLDSGEPIPATGALMQQALEQQQSQNIGISNSASISQAIAAEQNDILQILLKHTGDINARNKNGECLLEYAYAHDNGEAVKMILARGGDPNSRSKDGTLLFHLALDSDRRELCKLFLEAGADVFLPDKAGKNALDICMRCGRDELLGLILQSGISLREIRPASWDFLMFLKQPEEMLAQLRERGLDINRCDSLGHTLLHSLIHYDEEPLLDKALAWGASPETAMPQQKTVLEQVAEGRDTKMLQRLLPYAPHKETRRAAFEAALKAGNHTMMLCFAPQAPELLDDAHAAAYLAKAVAMGEPAAVSSLLAMGVDVKSEAVRHAHIPQLLFRHFDAANFEKLVDAGLDLNSAEEGEDTALQMVLKQEQLAYASMLLEKGARISREDANAALIRAAAKGDFSLAKMMLEEGAGPLAADASGRNALNEAQKHGQRNMEIYLRRALGENVDNASPRGDELQLRYQQEKEAERQRTAENAKAAAELGEGASGNEEEEDEAEEVDEAADEAEEVNDKA